MYATVAATSPMTTSFGSPKSLLPLLILLPLIARVPVEALQCYDCLTLALPACMNGSALREVDKTPCKPDEIYCSVLVMNDSVGRKVVSRQCASREDEGEQLLAFVAPSHDKPLKMIEFVTCKTNLCNVYEYHQESRSGQSSHSVSSDANKPSNGSAGTLLAAPFAALGVLALGVMAADILRPAA